MCPATPDPIQYARLRDGIVVIRVLGKGTFQQSAGLLHVFEITRDQQPAPHYVIDLDQCTTMDSTFMGTLASIGLHQRRTQKSQVIVANIKDHVRYLLNTLGLQYILDLRPDKVALPPADGAYAPANAPEMNNLDRILMMIEAHEYLIDIDSQNEVKFEGVLQSLRDSLHREQGHS
jgi:anti-anti-sigma regulatory factor